jgi:type IV secretion system protein VirB1
MDTAALLGLVALCAPLVAPSTAYALMRVESSFNPYAIGVVGGSLQRQPRTYAEALATARQLHSLGYDYSVGLAQINQRNFARLSLTIESAFDPCRNLQAMQRVLGECMSRSQQSGAPQRALRDALSCYYSGDFRTGYRDGYVRRVAAAVPRLTSAATQATSPP